MPENTTPDDASCEVPVRLDDETSRTLHHVEVDAEEPSESLEAGDAVEEGEVTPR